MKGVDLEIGIGIGIGIGRYQHKSTWYRYRNSKCGIAQHYKALKTVYISNQIGEYDVKQRLISLH